MSRRSDEHVRLYAEGPGFTEVKAMARELLECRKEHIRHKVLERLAAAEKVIEKARNPQCDVGRNWSGAYVDTSWHDDLEEALEAYDKVVKSE